MSAEAVDVFESHTGKDVTGRIDALRVAIGNTKLMEALNVAPCGLGAQAEAMRAALADHRRRHEFQLRVGGDECAAAQPSEALRGFEWSA